MTGVLDKLEIQDPSKKTKKAIKRTSKKLALKVKSDLKHRTKKTVKGKKAPKTKKHSKKPGSKVEVVEIN